MKQKSLCELWGRDVKRRKVDDESAGHAKLKKRLDEKTWFEFQSELASQRASERVEATEREHKRSVRDARLPGGMDDPSGETRGYLRNPAKGLKIGRPKYSHDKQVFRVKHTRELGGGS